MRVRKCQEPGFSNLKKPWRIDDYSLSYTFCPGKATWFEEILSLFRQCRVAMETGIMPKEGSFEDQDTLFCDVFPAFVERWKDRFYAMVWRDVRKFTQQVLQSIFSGKKGK